MGKGSILAIWNPTAILHGINNLRNNYSMAHPTETLLNEADARFAINLVRSIMTYVDELL